MSKGQSLQDPFLNALRKDRVAVAIFLVNGIKLQGYIESFDRYVVLLKNNVSQMVYKHAISTIVPIRTQQRQGFDTPRQGFDGTRQAFDNRSFDNRGFGAERNFDNRGFDSARQNFSRYPQNTGFGYKKTMMTAKVLSKDLSVIRLHLPILALKTRTRTREIFVLLKTRILMKNSIHLLTKTSSRWAVRLLI